MRQAFPILALAVLTGLAACSDHVVSVSEESVNIRYDYYRETPESLLPIAEEECAAFDKEAEFRKTVKAQGLIARYALFDCVD